MRRRLTLTARLTLLYTLVSASVLLVLGVLVTMATQDHFIELDRDFLQGKARLVQQIVDQTPAQPGLLARRLDEVAQSQPGLLIRLERAGRAVYAPSGIRFPAALAGLSATDTTVQWKDGTRALRGMSLVFKAPAHLVDPASRGGSEMRLMIALDTGHHTHFMAGLRQTLGLYLLLATLVSGVLGWWAARSGLAPLRVMKERAQMVTALRLDQRMPVAAVPVELAELALSLNTMLERLQRDFDRLSEFSSDLAHELRTPISNLLTQTQVSLAQRRDADTYREILASNAEEFQRLARMVSDMLFLAKTEHAIALPSREAISLGHEVQVLFDFYDALAEAKHIRLTLDGDADIVGDRLMVRRAISNLLSNALRYSPVHGCIEVSVRSAEGQISLCVQNTGPVIDVVHLPRLFDRFYRIDRSRAQPESDGTGLGLSITKAILEAHGGTASAWSSAQKTTFCLSFPVHQRGPCGAR